MISSKKMDTCCIHEWEDGWHCERPLGRGGPYRMIWKRRCGMIRWFVASGENQGKSEGGYTLTHEGALHASRHAMQKLLNIK
jgi:hypothetical protein